MALVRMQIAAQARNRRWHEFLCSKRDELQTRLRQQGFSQQGTSTENAAIDHKPDPEGAEAASARDPLGRWGAPGEVDVEQDVADEPSQDVDVHAAEALDWWKDEGRGGL